MKLQRTGSIWDRADRNGINNNWERLEGILNSVNEMVVRGQLTPAQFSQLIQELNGLISKGQVSVYDIDKNKGLLDQSFLSPELLEQIAGTAPVLSEVADGSVTTNKVSGRAITPEKTTFFDIGENLFDGNYRDGLLVSNNDHNDLEARENYGGIQGKIAVVKLEPNTKYSVSVDGSNSNVFRVGAHESPDYFFEEFTGNFLNKTIFSDSVGSAVKSVNFTTDSNNIYIYIYVSNEGKEPNLQIYGVGNTHINETYIPPIRQGAVSPEQTSFFTKGGGELFDGNYYDGMIVTYHTQGGVMRLTSNYDGYKGKTAIIPISPNTKYVVNVNSVQSNVLRIATHDKLVNFEREPNGTPLNQNIYSGSEGDTLSSYTFTSSNNAHFIYIYVSNEAIEADLSVTESELNLESQWIDGLLVAYENHTELNPRLNYSWIEGKTKEYKVEPNTTYSVVIGDEANILRIASHPTEVTFRSSSGGFYMNNTHYSSSQDEHINQVTFTTGNNDKFLYVYVSNQGVEADINITKGVLGYVIPQHYLDLSDINTGISSEVRKNYKYNIPGDFASIYKQPEITDYISNPLSISPQSVHDMFISTVNDHSDIASYEKIGEDDFGYNLYKYESKPLEYYDVETDANNSGNDDGNTLKNPKIVITAGLHGREKSASYALYYFFRELLDNPTNNPTLDAIKTNIHLILMPICSPSGFVDNSYSNRNGQNINRDFPPYGNVTQAESKVMKKLIDDNIDMDYFIDFHNMFMRDGLIGYSLTDDEFFKYASLNMYKSVGRSWQKSESLFPQSMNHRFAYTSGSNVGTVGRYVKDELGIPSSLLELTRESEFLGGGDHGEPTSRIGVDILVNMITACIRNEM